ncbi:MAG: hypothetical protein HUU46_05640 [Candidatus Hydrogenedentes bacterium]|nr:hypothetical protein [Candidatus Hydrogenedentota bacterium]
MIEKPIEWRRFERVELEGDVARTAPRGPVIPAVPNPPSLLQEFERVLRENERLRLEVATLRAEADRNGVGTEKFRKELRSASVELAMIEGPAPSAGSAPSVEPVSPEPAAEAIGESPSPVAAVVAEYIFGQPTEGNIRLVEDALRGRGLLGKEGGA